VARSWVQAVVEALNGRRPISQLEGWFSDQQRQLLRQRGPSCRAAGGARLAGWRVQSPSPAVLEVTATLLVPPKVVAGAFRLALKDDHWRCVDLVLG
jgi:hypothetical protein